jgi:DNA polymerase-3 subunit delta
MKYDQIISDLENKIYHPVYLLHGDEPYYIDEITDFIEENVLNETEKEFNLSIVYGRDIDAAGIIEYAKRYPMMASYQVVIVKEAQEVKDLEGLAPYAESPLDSTILVLAHKYRKVDKRRLLAKTAGKKGVLFESSKIYDNKIPDWIRDQLDKMGYSITLKASMMLSENLGNNLSKIRNELDKLVINLEEGTDINEDVIERNIGISKDYNIFELTGALGRKDILKANRIVNYFIANPKIHPLILTLTMLYNYFVKLMIYHKLTDKSRNNVAATLSINPFFVKEYSNAARNYQISKLIRIIGYIRDYDLRLKGIGNSNTSEGELLKELVFKILH